MSNYRESGKLIFFGLCTIVQGLSWRHMENCTNKSCSADLAGSFKSLTLVWGAPILAIGIGLFMEGAVRSILWTIGTFVAGTACLINARGCGRLHCYFTGPFFIACAIATVAFQLGWFPLSATAWRVFGAGILIGGIVLYFVPEYIWGRFRKSDSEVILTSTLTCPNCGFQKSEQMPTDACQFFYVCTNCGERLRPKQGDCCVFCSYGTVKCPSKQGIDKTELASLD